MDYRGVITRDPGMRSGQACVRGMRITVTDVLDALAREGTMERVVEEFPYLTLDDVRACVAYRRTIRFSSQG